MLVYLCLKVCELRNNDRLTVATASVTHNDFPLTTEEYSYVFRSHSEV